MANADIAAAKNLYLDYGSGAHSSVIGAYIAFSEEEDRQFRFRARQDAIADTFETVGGPDTLKANEERGALTLRVPSPWHCVIHFIAHCRGWLDGRVLGRSSSLIYRGQGDSSWPLVASLHRDETKLETERDTIYAFVNIVERCLRHMHFTNLFAPSLMLLTDEKIPKGVYVAAGQHYGVRTQLLDFSADPAVAVWFANADGVRRGSREVSVFALPTRFAVPSGAAVILPHPFVTRLYRQRGLFVETPLSPVGLRQMCVEVRFPPDPDFSVMRDGKHMDLLETEPFWTKCVELARDIVERGEVKELLAADNATAFGMLSDFPGYPAVAHAQQMRAYLRYTTNELLQMLLAITVAATASGPRVLRHAVRWLESSSRDALLGMYPLLRHELSLLSEQSALRQSGMLLLENLRSVLGESDVYEWTVL